MLNILLAHLLLLLAVLGAAPLIKHPGVDFSLMGGRIALLGEYDALSFYNYVNDSAFVGLSVANSLFIYLRNSSDGTSQKIATLSGGSVSLLQPLSDASVLVSGNFSSLNGQDYQLPVIYNASSGDFYSLFSQKRADDSNLSGNVLTTFVDGDLIYLGGDFQFNNTNAVAVYNVNTRSLLSLPFEGFGDNSTVNSIIKVPTGDSEDASIIFGGSFNSLGLPELLTHNSLHFTKHLNSSNSTNTTFITAEQVVSLKHATFGNVNGASSNDDSTVICPSSGETWSLQDNSGGQWNMQLPLEMLGITPTKVRIYVPENSQDGIKNFRLYTYPNNGIMNLSYIDPDTNEMAYCDASCPLQLGSTLTSSTESNLEHEDAYLEEDLIYLGEDGSFFMYYSPETKTRTLGYGQNYQEFALINLVGVDKIGLTATAWYGSRAEFSGFELYLNSIAVYGNDTLNESNCGSESNQDSNLAVINSGTWQPVTELSDITSNDYIVSVGSSGASISLYPNISYAGNYSLLFYTPGCSADGSCAKRSIVNVAVIDTDNNTLSSVQLYQNNLEDKFDYLFYGHFNGSSENEGRNKVTIDFVSAIDSSVTDPWTVVDKVVANIVSLDNYDSKNLSNSTKTHKKGNSTLTTTKLNGLFEYSLANFSLFDLRRVYEGEGNDKIIKQTNNYVGNSSINILSGELSNSSVVNQISYILGSKQLLLLGEFESSRNNFSNNELLTLLVSDYNTTSNETNVSLQARRLSKRANFGGLSFNNTITKIENIDNGFVVLGRFVATGDNIINLSDDNNTVSSADNFALNADGQWYSFGNAYRDDEYSQFTSIDVDDTEYFVFSSENGDFQIWDNTHKEWSTLNNKIEITASINLSERDQQVIAGPSFGTMQYFEGDQAFFLNNSSFSAYDMQVMNGSITNSYYVNSSFSVFGGKFADNSTIENIALIKNNKAEPLTPEMNWADDTFVSSLYVDSKAEHLFIGSNGSVSFGRENNTGLVIYNLQNASFLSVQPADLSNSDGSEIAVNAMAFNDDSQQLLVGGRFENAGSLSCSSLCFYDIGATRWISPMSGSDSTSIEGEVTDAKFLDSNVVLISGNLTLNSTRASFMVYDFSTGDFAGAGDSINDIGSDGYITKFIINLEAKGHLDNQMAAITNESVLAYNTSAWSRIDGSIEYSEETQLSDLKLIKLSAANSSNSQKYFSNDKVLLLSGKFNLTDYGLVNVAMYDGRSWIPYVFATDGSGAGVIHSTLFEDVYRYQSSDDLKRSLHRMTTGQVVGVSFACALGSTALLGLLFIIPFFFLFKRKRSAQLDRRTHEDEMLNAVNPGHLFHEMDAQRRI